MKKTLLIFSFVLFMQPLALAAKTVPAAAGSGLATIEAVVPDIGQGRGPRNVAADQTKQFEQAYNQHSRADIVFSEINFLFFDLLAVIVMVLIAAEYQHFRYHQRLEDSAE